MTIKSTKKSKEYIGMKGNEATGKRKKFRQEERTENADNEIEENHEDDGDDLFDSAIEATQRDEFLQSISAIFIGKAVSKQ